MKRFKRFKIFILTEGWGVVKRNYVKTGKLAEDDLNAMQRFLSELGDKSGKMSEWLAQWWVEHRDDIDGKKYKSSYSAKNKKHRSFKGFVTYKDYTYLFNFFKEAISLRNSGVLKELPPKSLNAKGVLNWLDKEANKYYSKKKMKIPSGLKKNTDYEEVYNKNGVQVFKIMTYEASEKLGGGCNWCVKRERDTWLQYVAEEEQAFYFIRNHRLNSDNPKYKLAVNVTYNDDIDGIWDRDDKQIGSNDNEIKVILKKLKLSKDLFKYFRANDADEYIDEQRRELEEVVEHYNHFIEECERWKEEKIENERDLNIEIENRQERKVGDLREELDSVDVEDHEEIERIEAEANRIEELSIEDYYDEFEGQYYSDYIWEGSEPSWFPSADEDLEEWWQEQGGHSKSEIKEQISYYIIDEYDELKLTNPNRWL